jgi:hypothetical protein
MAQGEVGTGEHGGQDRSAEAFAASRTLEERHGLPEAVDRLTIVALCLVGEAEGLIRQRVQGDFPTGHGKREGALSDSNGPVMRAHDREMA